MGRNMVAAGLTVRDKAGHSVLTPEEEPEQLLNAEKRVTAMCIDAALTEDDFETAYSYVVTRLAALSTPRQATNRKTSSGSLVSKAGSSSRDDWSWRAALQAGMYRRTVRTVRPTHLGTSVGNPELRHLEQRIECLATALRIAPASTLSEILKSYRRTEEELNAAIKAEQENEEAWNDAADDLQKELQGLPGAFGAEARRKATETRSSAPARTHNVEEAPMSLFDLSRASMRSAQRNFTALSNFNITTQSRPSDSSPQPSIEAADQQNRTRKRDQLREVAVGGLTAGVGWLIGAQPVHRQQEEE